MSAWQQDTGERITLLETQVKSGVTRNGQNLDRQRRDYCRAGCNRCSCALVALGSDGWRIAPWGF
jgi:hypothetical protein